MAYFVCEFDGTAGLTYHIDQIGNVYKQNEGGSISLKFSAYEGPIYAAQVVVEAKPEDAAYVPTIVA